MRTAFNLLGPLTNPAGAARQLVGVPRPELTELVARSLGLLGSARAWVVHGADGLDEISTTGYTKVSEYRDGAVNTFYVHPADVGLSKAAPEALRGGDATENARIARDVLAGARGAARDIVLLNAGASLLIAGAARGREGRHPSGGRRPRLWRRRRDAGAAHRVVERRAGGRMTNGTGSALVSDLLETIVAATRCTTEARSRRIPIDRLERQVTRQPKGQAFHEALRTSPTPRVIAECKRRSPSKGILRKDYDPAAHAAAYAGAGAAAISVLTEPTFFDGSLDHLAQVRAAVDLPILRKDFIVTEYQLVEAVAFGADAVLLIVGALDDRALRTLLTTARGLGLAALVEVHDVAELARAVERGSGRHRRQQPQPADVERGWQCPRTGGPGHAVERDGRRGERHSHAWRHRPALGRRLQRVSGR